MYRTRSESADTLPNMQPAQSEGTTTVAKRRLPPEVRRAEIIEVAHAAILEDGYRALSLREVARRCGMSGPGLMHYFPDMPTLLEAVLAHRDEVDLNAIFVGGAADSDRSVMELVDMAMAYYADRTAETSAFDALEAEALDPHHPAHDWFAERNRRNRELLRPAVEREYDDPDTVMRLLGYIFDGARLRGFDARGNPTLAADWPAVRGLLESGLPGRRNAGPEAR